MAAITYADKTDNRVSSLPENKKVTAATFNEIKTSVNAIYSNAARISNTAISFGVFTGSVYTNLPLLGGLTVYTSLNIWSLDTGKILKNTTDFTYDSGTGAITMVAGPGNYLIQVVLPLV
jgi:hypothetical protein